MTNLTTLVLTVLSAKITVGDNFNKLGTMVKDLVMTNLFIGLVSMIVHPIYESELDCIFGDVNA